MPASRGMIRLACPARSSAGIWKTGFQLLAHLSMDSEFPSDKVERERSLILNQIKTEPDRPIQYTISVLNQTLFPSHPVRLQHRGESEERIRIFERRAEACL